jgi:hypothetical protein
MGCIDINFGDGFLGMGKVYISLMSGNIGRSANLHSYPRGIGWFGISHWGDQISSFEFYQTNGFRINGHQI